MNLLVTGGAGFIGSNLIPLLLGQEAQQLGANIQKIVTLDQLTYAANRENLRQWDSDPRQVFIHGSITDSPLVAVLLRTHQIDAVIHLAAESHVDRSITRSEEFIQTNIVGTHRLLEETRRYWHDTRLEIANPRFLHVSTDEVFGSLAQGGASFSENSPYAPNSPYSASKAASDHLVRAYHQTYGLPTLVTHCSNNYGPYQSPEKLIPLMIHRLLSGEALPVYGDGLQSRDWLHVDDHCRALMMVLLAGTVGGSYLIGGRAEMRNIDVVHTLIECFRRCAPERLPSNPNSLIQHVQDRLGHDRRYAINPIRIERELGWAARRDFQSGIEQTVRWYLDHLGWLKTMAEQL